MAGARSRSEEGVTTHTGHDLRTTIASGSGGTAHVPVSARFFDRQDPANPLNGQVIRSSAELRRLLHGLLERPPFFAELIGSNGFKLLIGIAATGGCAQYSAVDGSVPYLMAVAPGVTDQDGKVEFLIEDTASPVPKRFILPLNTLVEVAEEFVRAGIRHSGVAWEEV